MSDLQTEASRLMRSLETQKHAFEAERAELVKRVEAFERDQQVLNAEIEQARDKIKQFADYDEVKRELEIMKVRLGFSCIPASELVV